MDFVMRIEYDPAKNARNIRERGLSFERTSEFEWDSARVEEDRRKPYPERRYVATGWMAGRLYVLCFTPITNGIRVISFRKANKREVASYETQTIDE